MRALTPAPLTPAPSPKPETETFPHDLIALVEPGEDITAFIDEQDQKQPVIEL